MKGTPCILYITDTYIIDNVDNDYYKDFVSFNRSKNYERYCQGQNIKHTEQVAYRKILKSGKVSDRWEWLPGNPYTPLHLCDLCSKISTPKKIQYRPMCYKWDADNRKRYWEGRQSGILCMGCWNKVRHIVKREEEVEQSRLLINAINREVKKCQTS